VQRTKKSPYEIRGAAKTCNRGKFLGKKGKLAPDNRYEIFLVLTKK